MSDELIARRFANKRPGYHLVSYRKVIAPLFKVTVRVLTDEKRELPPIPQFILRSVDAGIHTTDEIAALLGLEKPIVIGGVHQLVQTNDILVHAPPNSRAHRLVLTERGHSAAEPQPKGSKRQG